MNNQVLREKFNEQLITFLGPMLKKLEEKLVSCQASKEG